VSYSRCPLPYLFVLIFSTVLVAVACVPPFWAQSAVPPSPKGTEDLPAGPIEAKATTACLECHEARIIVQQRLSRAAWAKEVDKMTKWGALVNPSDRDALIDYLSANFGPDQPPYEAPRSSPGKTAQGKVAPGKSTHGKNVVIK
jgi:hypothetical protein